MANAEGPRDLSGLSTADMEAFLAARPWVKFAIRETELIGESRDNETDRFAPEHVSEDERTQCFASFGESTHAIRSWLIANPGSGDATYIDAVYNSMAMWVIGGSPDALPDQARLEGDLFAAIQAVNALIAAIEVRANPERGSIPSSTAPDPQNDDLRNQGTKAAEKGGHLGLIMDENERTVRRIDCEASEPIGSRVKAWRVLEILIRRGHSYSQNRDLAKAWEEETPDDGRIQQEVSWLRSKLKNLGLDIKNDRGVGYKLVSLAGDDKAKSKTKGKRSKNKGSL